MAEGLAEARPVAITMRRELKQRGPWRFAHWTLLEVRADSEAPAAGVPPVQAQGKAQDYVWRGHWLRLYPDAAESYWYNLTGAQPSLFVVCRPTDELEMEPFMVTADDDEASAMMEVDESVFSIAMPSELIPWVQRWVVTHYRAAPRKQHKPKRGRLGEIVS